MNDGKIIDGKAFAVELRGGSATDVRGRRQR